MCVFMHNFTDVLQSVWATFLSSKFMDLNYATTCHAMFTLHAQLAQHCACGCAPGWPHKVLKTKILGATVVASKNTSGAMYIQ